MKKNVCVIGAGPSGLVTVKELVEKGHNVTCYEKSPKEGGVFCKTSKCGVKAYDSLLLTVSNYFMAYSGMPPSIHEGRRFWSRREYEEYLQKYADTFHLRTHMQFNSTVTKVEPHDDGFNVFVSQGNEESSSYFDAIAICVGITQNPITPDFEGRDSFKGEVLHSANYDNPSAYRGKKVVCVGMGESGADIAHQIANVASECTLSIRHYPSILDRWFNQQTNDAFTAHAFCGLGAKGMNDWYDKELQKCLDNPSELTPEHKLTFEWALKTKGYFNQFITKSEVFVSDIVEKRLGVNLGGIKKLSGNRVIFHDGEEVEADVIMCSTGFQEECKVTEPWINLNNVRDLFKHMLHPDWGNKLAYIGTARPIQGGVPACSEMQARYFALVLAEERKLPESKVMKEMIERDRRHEESSMHLTPNIKGLVDYEQYMPEMARLIGCNVKLRHLMNPYVLYKFWYGSHLPVIYRITGPGKISDLAKKIVRKLPVAYTLREQLSLSIFFVIHKLFRRHKKDSFNISNNVVAQE